jgi:hypothetical protein
MKQILLGAISLALLVGCSSVRVNTDYAAGTDFSAYQTFRYQDSDDSVADSDPLAHQRIVEAIRRGMFGAGLAEVEADADVFVTYRASTDQQLRFDTTYSGVSSWGRRGRHMGVGMTTSTTRATTVTEGTLVIDVWDATRNSMVWRAVATSSISENPSRNTKTINQAVEKAFGDFPPN